MRFSTEFIFRIIGAIAMAVGGLFLGLFLGETYNQPPELWGAVFFFVGMLVGLVVTPYLTTRPAVALRDFFSEASRSTLVAALAGLIAGLVAAALLTSPLSQLPSPIGSIAPLVGVVVFVWMGITLFVIRKNDIYLLWSGLSADRGAAQEDTGHSASIETPAHLNILLDTSVLIDGRIADISKTGFLFGTLIVPRFVLIELQHIADSADALRRNRGRRGLDILSRLQKESDTPVRITEMDVDGMRQVDDKLVALAKQLRCPVLTNDYNLNRVAEIQSVKVLNINDLANAVKVVLLPGENLSVKVIQEGKEHNQGVGYLDDGTMVVIEDGKPHIGSTLDTMVTKVLQTTAGRMIFARIDND